MLAHRAAPRQPALPKNPAMKLHLASLLLLVGCTGAAPAGTGRLDVVRSLPYLDADEAPAIGQGQPVVVEFWATWCPPCVQSVPHLVEIDQRFRPEGLVLVGVHAKRGAEDEDGVRRFLESRDVEYPIALDHEGAAARAFGVSGIPHAFVFDRSGSLVWDGLPMDPAFADAVERAVGG